MSIYKLVSFDIWQTLIKSNAAFVEARNVLFAEALQYTDLVHLKAIKDEIDISMDTRAEETGEDANFNIRMTMMMDKLKKSPIDFPEDFFTNTYKKLDTLFTTHLPELIEPKTIDIFKDLKKRGLTIALLSNTGFIHGETMRPALTSLGIFEYVDYAFFSNEIGFSKPHKNMYDQLTDKSGFLPSEILHVGDSLKADYHGAWSHGIHSLLFDSKNTYGNRYTSIHNMSELMTVIDSGQSVLHIRNLSLYSLHEEEGVIMDEQKNIFDLIQYSKFKYGDGHVAKVYGHQLAKKFIETYSELFNTDNQEINLVITTSPYKAIVKGSSGIVKGFKNYINQHLTSLGKTAIVDITILKKEMFQGDYGTFTDEQRKELMHKNDLSIMENFIVGKKLILIDDARITGSHEANLITFLKSKNIAEAFFLYIADMELKFALEHPDIESVMNHGWVDGLNKVSDIMNSAEFILNARVCKYVLSIKDQSELETFFTNIKDNVLYDLYNGIVGDGYNTMSLYTNSFETLKKVLVQKNLILQGNFPILM